MLLHGSLIAYSLLICMNDWYQRGVDKLILMRLKFGCNTRCMRYRIGSQITSAQHDDRNNTSLYIHVCEPKRDWFIAVLIELHRYL